MRRFSIDANASTADHAMNVATLAQQARNRIAIDAKACTALADPWCKRLIAYEGGQDQLAPANQARLMAMKRDSAMEDIYRQYLTSRRALPGDLFTLNSGTTQ